MAESSRAMPSVAIIGGGIAGLSCGRRLLQKGFDVRVFDTGKRAIGGRCSHREIQVSKRTLLFDHSVQYVTAHNEGFLDFLKELQIDKIVRKWTGNVGSLNASGEFTKESNEVRFVTNGGFGNFAKALAKGQRTQINTWVASVLKNQETNRWKINKGKLGEFDYVVIAHNGKCADRLMKPSGVPAIHRLLRVKFLPENNPKINQMQLSSLYMLMVCFPKLDLPFEGACPKDSKVLSWVCNNTAKLNDYERTSGAECWTLVSTKHYGHANKAPMEHLPKEVVRKVTREMLAEFSSITGKNLGKPIFQRLQLWGAALPMNILKQGPSVIDPENGVGICGDWLVSPSVEGAFVSGYSLAEQIDTLHKGRLPRSVPRPVFQDSGGKAIGCFTNKTSKSDETKKPIIDKDDIRRAMWDYMERKNLAEFPRPVHGRIPNFVNARVAAEKLRDIPEFVAAKVIKVNPDSPQKAVRELVLQMQKTLLVPTPRLRKGLFNRIVVPDRRPRTLKTASTKKGIQLYGQPVGLNMKLHVDVVIIGAVAVDEKGWRIGKGEGFADLELAMMSCQGAVDETTTVIATVHDCQVRKIPDALIEEHDITLDYIVTPTRIIKVDRPSTKPAGVLWHKLDMEKFHSIPILKKMREIDRERGKDVRLKEEVLGMDVESVGSERSRPHGGGNRRGRGRRPRGRGRGRQGNRGRGDKHGKGDNNSGGRRRRRTKGSAALQRLQREQTMV